MNESVKLYQGDCLEIMDRLIEQGVKVDAIITDPPYGTTACKWDSVIPFDAMWERLKKLRKENTPIVLFGSEPFSSALRMSNIKEYKYDWVWNKKLAGNAILAKKQPLKFHENIIVFNSKIYNPQKTIGKSRRKMTGGMDTNSAETIRNSKSFQEEYTNNLYYPQSIQEFSVAGYRGKNVHPTQKPIELMEYLIKTYTNEGDTVLDFTMGSGSTGVAALNTNRKFIGIELDENYFNIAEERIHKAIQDKESQTN